MIKLVSDNPIPARNKYDDRVAETFAAMAANILEFIADGDEFPDLDKIEAFKAAVVAQATNVDDPNGIMIRKYDLSDKGGDDPDDAINSVLRPALKQVAALLLDGRGGSPRYEAARDEITRGIVKLNKKAAALSKRSRK